MHSLVAVPGALTIGKLWGEFASPETESRFLRHRLADTRALLRFTLLFCAVFFVGFSLTDVAALGYGRDTVILLLARLSVAATAITGVWFVAREGVSVRATRLIACIAEIVAITVFMCITVYRPAEFHWHAMSLAIMLIVIYLYIPNRLAYATLVATLATVTFIAIARHMEQLSGADMLTMTMLLVLTNTFGAVAARRFQRVSREEFCAQMTLANTAVRDHLTGCFNRRFLHDNLLHNDKARASHLGRSHTVIICDLDHFKQINDTYGHAGGDLVLHAFSRLLRESTRDGIDSVVRYGGEEFLLILPDTDLAGGTLLAERLRSSLAALVIGDASLQICVTASFGVASVTSNGANTPVALSKMILAADEVMYQAKKNGRNRVESVELGTAGESVAPAPLHT